MSAPSSYDKAVGRIAQDASTRLMVVFDALITMGFYVLGGWPAVAIWCIAGILVGIGGLFWGIRKLERAA